MIKKVIGYGDANLINYKTKFNVDVNFDRWLISDQVYSLSDLTTIGIIGTREAVEYVAEEINDIITDLELKTINIPTSKLYSLKEKLCNIKSEIDPVELRKSA